MKISPKKLIIICSCAVFLILLAIILALIFWPRIPVIGFYNISEANQSKYVNMLQDSIEDNFGIIPYKSNLPFSKQFNKTKCDILFTYRGELTQNLSEEISDCIVLPLYHEHFTILSDSSIPENFADLINHAKALKKSGTSPICFAGADDYTLLDFISLYAQTRCGTEGVTKLANLFKSGLDFEEILERSLHENVSLKILLNEIIDLKKAQIISPDYLILDKNELETLAVKKQSAIFLMDYPASQKITAFTNKKNAAVCDELCAVIIKNRKINKKSADKFIDTVFVSEEKLSSDFLSIKHLAFEDLEKLSKTAALIRSYLNEAQ